MAVVAFVISCFSKTRYSLPCQTTYITLKLAQLNNFLVYSSMPISTSRPRLFCDEKNKENKFSDAMEYKLNKSNLNSKFSLFKESEAPVLLDVYEEKMLLENDILNVGIEDSERDELLELNLNRGVHGVYDIEDLVELLKREKAEDIFVAVLPKEANYVDHIVVVSGRSKRHMTALADLVRRVFKKKRFSSDILPKIEGENSKDWMALDLGNIALHIFSRDARSLYDLESLWSVGPSFDPLVNKPDDPLIALLKKHAMSLNDINTKGELL